MTAPDTGCEVWYGRKWCRARLVVRRGDGWVRAVVPEVSDRTMTFRPSEVRDIPRAETIAEARAQHKVAIDEMIRAREACDAAGARLDALLHAGEED